MLLFWVYLPGVTRKLSVTASTRDEATVLGFEMMNDFERGRAQCPEHLTAICLGGA